MAETSETGSVVGQSVIRKDLLEKVTGAAEYSVDASMPGMAHAKVVRSDRAHARILSVDTQEATALPGVVGVLTSADLEGLFPRFGHIIPDHCILAIEKVRYYGEPVAIVVGDTPHAAADAAALVHVRYEDLPSVMDARAALEPDAPLVHDEIYPSTGDESFKVLTGAHHTPKDRMEGGPSNIATEDATGDGSASEGDADRSDDTPVSREPSNIGHEVHLEWGDVDDAFANAHLVVESDVRFPMLYGYAMEPYNALASFTDSGLVVIASQQHPYMARDDLARVFGLPLSRVRVIAPYIGGGYGTKSYTKVEPMAAVASWYVRRPVKLVLDVEESIYTTRVDSAEVKVRSGFTEDGTIVAREFDILMDSGAYADNSPLVLAKSVNRCGGPYRVPNLRVRGRSMYTNTSPASSYRGFGAPQGNFPGEINLNRAADELGISRADIRRRNLVDKGEQILPGKRGLDADIKADLEMVLESLHRDAKETPGYGIGFGCSASDAGAYPVSTAQVRIQVDGSAVVLSGSTEMGQGSRSVLAQVAAEELGIPLDQISVAQADTSLTAYERTTGASRTTTLAGLALQKACADARSRVRDMAADVLGCDASAVADAAGGVTDADGAFLSYGEVIAGWFGAAAGEVTGVGLLRREGVTKEMPPFWELGMVGVGVQVDGETGVVTVDQLVTVGDVGFAINPAAVEAQDLGAATQGLGGALYEELVYDGPQLANANVVDYRVPRMKDIPRKIDLMLAERRDGIGPYGAKGAGEGALNPIGGAVAAAVADAVGTWPEELPLTPERVWRLLQARPALPEQGGESG